MRGGAMNDYTLAVWEDWLAKQSAALRETAERCPPWGIYQFRDRQFARLDGLFCTIANYQNDGSLVVRFTQDHGNQIASSEILLDHITPDQLFFTPPRGQIN